MYDRKTWAVLAICGSLLAVNLYFSNQNQKLELEKRQAEERLQKANTPADTPVKESTAQLSVEPPPPPTEEELVTLRSGEVEFTLTNIGGGIKFAEFEHEFAVGSKSHDKDQRVKINRFGSGAIGSLVAPDDSLENNAYAYKADESIAIQR